MPRPGRSRLCGSDQAGPAEAAFPDSAQPARSPRLLAGLPSPRRPAGAPQPAGPTEATSTACLALSAGQSRAARFPIPHQQDERSSC